MFPCTVCTGGTPVIRATRFRLIETPVTFPIIAATFSNWQRTKDKGQRYEATHPSRRHRGRGADRLRPALPHRIRPDVRGGPAGDIADDRGAGGEADEGAGGGGDGAGRLRVP